jgi:hypothetical protein
MHLLIYDLRAPLGVALLRLIEEEQLSSSRPIDPTNMLAGLRRSLARLPLEDRHERAG